MSELLKDSELRFPHCMILKASAGAGKTWALTGRYVQFLLSERIQNNKPRNILAITFSNNAAKEMKERILNWLKKLYFKDKDAIDHFTKILDCSFSDKKPEDILSEKAAKALEELLNNYSDFQVKTIDSFMTSVFKASATDFGYNPDFEILMNNQELLSYAFELFIKNLRDGSKNAKMFAKIIELVLEMKSEDSSYTWDPAEDILEKWKEIYRTITANAGELIINRNILKDKKKTEEALDKLIKEIIAFFESLDSKYLNQRLSIHKKLPEIHKNAQFINLLTMKTDTLPLTKKTPKTIYQGIKPVWEKFCSLLNEYAEQHAMTFYLPYLEAFHNFSKELEKVKVREEKLFIEDINKTLSAYIDSSIVPDIYFRLGEKICHFLIDEFQDTSPLQWKNLTPLIENALSASGSLFVVGDTKQAIYEFRNADYRIMKQLENEGEKIFPSAKENFLKKELEVNYRSGEEIVRFNEKLFKETIASIDDYREAASLSGLTYYIQNPKPENKEKGYVEVKGLQRELINDYIVNLINDIKERGYNYKDIAILASENKHIVAISEYLNRKNIQFISYSSLDVRNRKVTSEFLALLAFLDSPTDDFSFAVFLKSDIYSRYLCLNGRKDIKEAIDSFLLRHRADNMLYKLFEKEFPKTWEKHFSLLFRLAGYLPLYDLINIILSTFKVFEGMPEEEATFLKLLELAGFFEARGFGNIRDFIEFMNSTGSDERLWDLSLPEEKDAVTLMTIHKAKGLEFPVAIVFITDRRRNSSSMVPVKSNNGISVMKITTDLTEKSEKLKTIKEEINRDRLTGELNLLYVAFTRAKDELYILFEDKEEKNNKKATGDNKKSNHVNLSRLLKEEAGKTRGSKSYPEKIEEGKEKKEERLTKDISHSSFYKEFPEKERKINFYEKERGEFIHEVLASIEYCHEGIEDRVSQVIEKLNRNSHIKFDEQEIKKSVINTLRTMEIYFKEVPGRIVKNEREFSDQMGFLYRMDRVVIDPKAVTVIDYKTGHPEREEMEEHIKQVSHYKKILEEIYKDKEIKGLLYYIYRKEAIEV